MTKLNFKALSAEALRVLLLLMVLTLIGFQTIRAQTLIAGWDVSNINVPQGSQNYGPSIFAATRVTNYAFVGGLVKSTGLTASTNITPATRAWGATGWDVTNPATQAKAITDSNFIRFTIQVRPGYTVSFSSIDTFDYRKSTQGVTNGVLQYSINNGAYNFISNVNYSSSSTAGASLGPINLSSVAGLQNLSSTSIVTFRIVNWGAVKSDGNPNPDGTWYIFDKSSSNAADFKISGLLSELPTNYYRSKANGNWSTVSIWESSPDTTVGSTWLPALAAPTSSAKGVEIRDTVTLDNPQTVNGRLKISSGTLVLNNKTLTIIGKVSSTPSATFSSTSGSSIIFGDTPNNCVGVLYFNPAANTIKDLNLAAPKDTITIGNALNITGGSAYGTVTIKNGNSRLYLNGDLTFKSNAQGSAVIGKSGNGGKIIGNVIKEVFIPARRAWRLITFPTSGSQTIHNSLQEGGQSMTLGIVSDPNPKYGTHITKAYADVTSLLGYDRGPQQNPSILRLDMQTNSWASFPSLSVPLSDEPTYFLFIRGDRSIDMSQATGAPPTTTTLRSKGSVLVGDTTVTYSNVLAGGFIPYANPYACPMRIDSLWNWLDTNQVDIHNFSQWDSKQSGANGVGAWILYSYGVINTSATYGNNADSALVLQANQSVMLKLKPGKTSAQITTKENAKVTTQYPLVFGKPMVPSKKPMLFRVNIYDNKQWIIDGAVGRIDNGESRSKSISSTSESIFLIRNKEAYVMERGKIGDTFLVGFNRISKGANYTLRFTKESFGADTMMVVDSLLHTSTLVPEQGIEVSFAATDSTAWKDRFFILTSKYVEPVVVTPPPVIIEEVDKGYYPNPVQGILHIPPTKATMVTITDALGRNYQLPVLHNTVDCSSLPSGIFFLKRGNEKPKKLIKI